MYKCLEAPKSNEIDEGWARAALGQACKRRYKQKQWDDEQLNDVAQTVLVQRPHVKMFLANMLKNEYRDNQASIKWKTFNPKGHSWRSFNK